MADCAKRIVPLVAFRRIAEYPAGTEFVRASPFPRKVIGNFTFASGVGIKHVLPLSLRHCSCAARKIAQGVRSVSVVVHRVLGERRSDAFEIAETLHGAGFLPCRVQGRQKHPGKDGDDRNYYKELYKGELRKSSFYRTDAGMFSFRIHGDYLLQFFVECFSLPELYIIFIMLNLGIYKKNGKGGVRRRKTCSFEHGEFNIMNIM